MTSSILMPVLQGSRITTSFSWAIVESFGIALETFTNDNRAALMHSPGTFGGQPVISRRIHADTRGNIARLLAMAVNQGALDAELSASDKAGIIQMLRNFGSLDGASNYNGTSRAGFPGQEDTGSRQRGEFVNPLALQNLINETFWAPTPGICRGYQPATHDAAADWRNGPNCPRVRDTDRGRPGDRCASDRDSKNHRWRSYYLRSARYADATRC